MAETNATTTTTAAAAPTFTQADIEKERAHTQHVTQQLQELQGKIKGVDIEALQKKAALADELQKKAAIADPTKVEELLKQKEAEIEGRFGSKLSEVEKDRDATKAALKKVSITNVGLQKAVAAGFLDKAMPIVQQFIEQQCDLVGEDIVIKGEDGKPRYSKADPRKLMTIDELLTEYGEKNDFLLANKTPSGGKGAENKAGATGGAAALPGGFENWTQQDQTKFFIKNPELRKQVLSQPLNLKRA
jgi:hypothetical protein